MKVLDSLRFRVSALFQRSRVNAELEEELTIPGVSSVGLVGRFNH